MADTTTTVLGLIKPEVGGSTDVWGPKYHAAMDAIDALFTDPAKKMLKLANGGTGADTAAGARTNLGLGALATLGSVSTAQIADGSVTAAKLAAGVIFPSGTALLFRQTAAPTGWTKDTTHNDKALRVVNGTVGSGGSMAFTSAFTSRSASGSTDYRAQGGTVQGHALTLGQMPSHAHPFNDIGGRPGDGGSAGLQYSAGSNLNYFNYHSSVTSYQGGNEAHSHGFSPDSHNHSVSTSFDMSVAYVDVIIAIKD